jgi:hypothetical protein
MNYHKGLVIFVDLLGTKNKIFDELYQINKLFHRKIKIKARENALFTTFSKKFVSSFSDCAYIVYEFDDDIFQYEGFIDIIKYCLEDLSFTLTRFVQKGLLFRGGISYGDVFIDKKENILFGPAINEAYLLEGEAVVPRIIFSKTIEHYYFQKNNVEYQNTKLDANYTLWNSVICLDLYDYRLFFNYLIRNVHDLDNDDFIKIKNRNGSKVTRYNLNAINDYLQAAEIFSINYIENCTNNMIIAKHIWQINYLKNMRLYYNDRKNYILMG